MLIHFFRASLKPTHLDSLFALAEWKQRRYEREEWLREYFSQQRTFSHRGAEFRYVPDSPKMHGLPEHLILGWIAKPIQLQERTPPSEGFLPTEHSSWRGALLIFDPREHGDGQKIGFEQRSDVGTSAAILKSLARDMSSAENVPYNVSIFPIAQESSFWRFAEEHDYQINFIRFNVAPPNMFGGADEFSKELRELRDRNNVNGVSVTLTSDTAIDTRQENIKQVVDYTEKGVGEILARTTSGSRYNSRNSISHDTIDGDTTDPGFWTRFKVWLDGRF